MIDHSGLQCEIRANWTPLRCNRFFSLFNCSCFRWLPLFRFYWYFVVCSNAAALRSFAGNTFPLAQRKSVDSLSTTFIQSCTSKIPLRQLWKANGMYREKGSKQKQVIWLNHFVFFLGLTAIQSSDRKCLDQVCGAIRLEDSLTAKESFVVKYQACKRQ